MKRETQRGFKRETEEETERCIEEEEAKGGRQRCENWMVKHVE